MTCAPAAKRQPNVDPGRAAPRLQLLHVRHGDPAGLHGHRPRQDARRGAAAEARRHGRSAQHVPRLSRVSVVVARRTSLKRFNKTTT